jgi:uncharacterized protein (TIGR02594 family)
VSDERSGWGAAFGAVAREPIFYVAMLTPVWSSWLSSVSEVAGKVGPVAAVALALARIYVVLRDSKADAKPGDRLEKSTTLAWSVATTAAKFGGKWLPAMAAALGAVAVVAWLTSGDARANPAAPPATSAKARKRKPGGDDGGNDGDAEGDCPTDAPEWYRLAWADRGVTEFKGKRHNPTVVAYFRDAGFSAIKDDETAWCAAAVNAWLVRGGQPGSRSLAAKSFMNWGKALDRPRVGCVVVLHRGDPKGWQGHVGLYAGETATHVLLLGGNQGDAVSVAKFPKSRVMPGGYRWPKGATDSRVNQGAAVSAASGGTSATAQAAAELPDQLPAAPIAPSTADVVPDFIVQVRDALQELAPILRGVAIVCAVLSVASAIYVIWRRTADLRERGV